MPTLTLPYTLTAGQPENVSELMANLVAIRDIINGQLDATNFATSAKPATLKGAYGTVAQAPTAAMDSGNGTSLHWMANLGLTLNGGNIGTAGPPYGLIVPPGAAASTWNVSGLTPKLRVVGSVACNNVAPGAGLVTFSLRPITLGGTGSVLTVTLGAAVGSIAVTPVQAAQATGSSVDFDIPATGLYLFGVQTSVAVAASAVLMLSARAELRHV